MKHIKLKLRRIALLKKRIVYILLMILFLASTFSPSQKAEAATAFKGKFKNVTYTETELKDGTIERKLNKITLANSAGKTVTFKIDESAVLSINNTLTTIDGFKSGMEVRATVSLRKVKELHGTSAVKQGAIKENSKQQSGIITKIDPNGMYITVKLDGQTTEKIFYVNKNTDFLKGSSAVDLSTLYEGDRVKLKFSSIDTSVASEIEIITSGIEIENLYKASIQYVNTASNKITVKNAQVFENWLFGTINNTSLETFAFTNNTPIYAGNKKITKSDLRNYKTSDVYFVTVNQFGKEIIKKIVVLESYERTYYEPLTAVNTSYEFVNLKTTGRIYFHEGTILVRNGRLIEPSTLTNYGTAFVVTDGVTKDNYAQVVHITNDGFTSPNLAGHELYFGELAYVDGYLAELNNLVKLENNYWKKTADKVLSFSNSTDVKINYSNSTFRIIPDMDLISYETYYGYYYVKNGHIQAIHLLNPSETKANQVLTGRIHSVDKINKQIDVKDVSQWFNGLWLNSGSLEDVQLSQTLIIKNGKVIEPSDLKPSDRIVLFTSPTFDCHVILVN